MLSDKEQRAIAERVARIFRAKRIQKRLSMNELAARAGLSQQMVSYVERGLRNPTLETMLRMAKAMDADLAAIIRQALRPGRVIFDR